MTVSDSFNVSCSCDSCITPLCGGIPESSLSALSCTPDTAGRVFTEVQWGENFRLNKRQEERYETATKVPVPPLKSPLKPLIKNIRVKQELPLKLCHCREVILPIAKEKKTIDRCLLNRKQHIELLAQPRKLPAEEIKLIKTKEAPKDCNLPRYLQLAVPLGRRTLENWKNYHHVLSPEHMNNFKNLLKKQDALSMPEANKYFKLLSQQRKKEKIKKKKLQMLNMCCRKHETKRDIDKLMKAVMKYFTKQPYSEVKDRHVVIRNELLDRLIDKSVKKLLRNSDQECSKTLYDLFDQFSVWVDQKVDEIDTADMEIDESSDSMSFSTFTTDSAITCSDAVISDVNCNQPRPKHARGG